jgi:hypothetical protein
MKILGPYMIHNFFRQKGPRLSSRTGPLNRQGGSEQGRRIRLEMERVEEVDTDCGQGEGDGEAMGRFLLSIVCGRH